MENLLLKVLPEGEVMGVGVDKIAAILVLVIAVVLSYLVERLVRRLLLSAHPRISNKLGSRAEIIQRHKVLCRASFVVFPLCLMVLIPEFFPREDIGDRLFRTTEKILNFYFYAVLWYFLMGLLSATNDILSEYNRRSVRGFIQTVQLGVSVVFIVFAVSDILGKSPLRVIAGLGASAAVLMLIFKDTLLGFSASVELAVNDILRTGDWITMQKYGADGIVLEIGLNVVKVRNWDNTVSSVPTYAFVSDAFENWRGVEKSRARRVRRAVNIDMQSVKFCPPEYFDSIDSAQIADAFLPELAEMKKQAEGGVKITNLTVFRKYLQWQLDAWPSVVKDMLHFVCLRPPTTTGVPLELYFFTVPDWVEYENVQSYTYEYMIACVRAFGLRVYQEDSDASSWR